MTDEPAPGAAHFADPDYATDLLHQIRQFADLLTDLHAGRIAAHFPMGAWIHQKATHLADAAHRLAENEL